MEESMEEEEMLTYEAMMDDQNHNNWEAAADSFRQPPPAPPLPPPPPPRPSSSIPDPGRELPGGQLLAVHAGSMERKGPKEGLPMGPPPLPEPNGVIMMLKSCDAAAAVAKTAPAPTSSSTININTSTSKFLMNVITIEDYKSTYWPKLDGAIDQLLTQSPGDYIPISYEQIYSCVYKCVCQQHSEQMYSDLIKKITSHLERVSKELQASPPDLYIERFNIALGQYMGALQSIVPLFIYMNKFYIETKLNRDLKDDLIKLFTEHVAEKHIYSLMQWVQMAPTLFSKFIPNILPPAVESELSEYAAQDQKLQRELIQNGFTRQVGFSLVTTSHFSRLLAWPGILLNILGRGVAESQACRILTVVEAARFCMHCGEWAVRRTRLFWLGVSNINLEHNKNIIETLQRITMHFPTKMSFMFSLNLNVL